MGWAELENGDLLAAAEAGARVLVAGNAVFSHKDYAQAIGSLTTLIDSYLQTRIEIPISASGAST